MSEAALDIQRVSMAEEAVYGVEGATYSAWPGRVKSFKHIIDKKELIISDISTQEEAIEAFKGAAEYAWECEFYIQNFIWMFWLMGTSVPSGAGPYTHTMTLAITVPGLSVEAVQLLGHANSYSIKYTGSKVEEATLNTIYGETPTVVLKAKAALAVVDIAPGTPPAHEADIPIEWHQSTTFTLNSVDYLNKCERASYTFRRGQIWDYSISQSDPEGVSEGKRGANVIYDIRILDEELLTLITATTDFPISHVITRGTHSLAITIANAKTFQFSPKSSGGAEGPRVETVPCRILNGYSAVAIDDVVDYNVPV